MAKTAANIVVGAPTTVIIGAYGAGEGAGVDVGSTEGGLKIVAAPEYYFKTADQWLGKVAGVKIAEDFVAEVVLAEATLANLALAFGYPTGAVASSTLDVGGDDTVTEREMYINGNGPAGATRKITVHKMIITGATEVPLLKTDKTGIKLTIQMLQDTSKAANKQYFSVVDASGDTTPPTVAMTTPAEDGTVGAGTQDTLTLTFTEADSVMDETTLIYGNADKATIFVNDVEDPTATALVAGSISYSATTKVLTFTPTSNWAAATNNYQIIITTSVRDTAGNYMANTFYGHFTST